MAKKSLFVFKAIMMSLMSISDYSWPDEKEKYVRISSMYLNIIRFD